MQIPSWVDAKKRRKADKASARLKYILTLTAAKHTGRQSIRALAERCGMNHSTISLYIRKGAFSEKAAKRIEEVIGREEIAAEFLMNPFVEERPPG
jgi:transcriptional regulator with XRE-family HTH domain